jgi:peptidoglycan/xylan/chitin deacetylase (PgdA/CDA1 family)
MPERNTPPTARRRILELAGELGAHRAAMSMTRRVPRILMYHRFSASPGWRRTDTATFESHLDFLAGNYRVRSLDQVLDRLGRGEEPERCSVVITVDDAYEDFYRLALPLIERRGLPVTLYVPTDFVDGKGWLWPDRLLWLITETRRQRLSFRQLGEMSLASMRLRRLAWNSVADELLEMNEVDRQAAFREIETTLDLVSPVTPDEGYRPMTWDEVRDSASRGVTIGSQASAHVPFARESAETQYQLALRSRNRLEAEIGLPVRHFSYPHGRARDFNDESVAAAKRAGFASSASATVTTGRSNLFFELPRFSPPSDVAGLKSALSGLSYLRQWVNR